MPDQTLKVTKKRQVHEKVNEYTSKRGTGTLMRTKVSLIIKRGDKKMFVNIERLFADNKNP